MIHCNKVHLRGCLRTVVRLILRVKSRPVAMNSLLVLLSISLSLLLAEISLRVVGIPGPLNSGWRWEQSPRREKNHDETLYMNQLVCRGQRIDYGKDDYVVVLIGDSQVEASTAPIDRMPERFLQANLSQQLGKPVKVFSVAVSGWGQDQQLIALKEYFDKYRADLVLAWATPGNDFWENAFPDRSLTSVAGHLKPTFKLVGDRLEGPFFESGAYYHHSAILQLIETYWAKRRKESLDQLILRRWMAAMPAGRSKSNVDAKSLGSNLKTIPFMDLHKNVYEIDDSQEYVVQVVDDFLNSRGSYCPFALERSERDKYLIRLTKKLFDAIETTASNHGAEFLVFCDVREANTRIMRMAKYIQPGYGNGAFPVLVDYPKLIAEIIPQDRLLLFELPGGHELSVSKEDGHLGDLGNEQAMIRVAHLVADRLKWGRGDPGS